MSLQAFGRAQSPLLPELSTPISLPPPPFTPFSSSSSPSAGDDTQPLVIEVPSDPGKLEASKGSNDNTIPREEIGSLRTQQSQTHNTILPSEPSPTPPSAVQKLIASIRQNLQEVKSILLHYPAPITDSKTRTDGIAEDTVDEDPGNTQHWPCKWFGVCGTIQWAPIPRRMSEFSDRNYLHDTGDFRKTTPQDWSSDSRVVNEIPNYVFEHAPLVHLFSGEEFWPCDMAEHLEHVTPNLNYTPILSQNQNLNLTNLDDLNEYNKGRFVYLKSDDNVEERPDWLGGQKNVPNVTAENPHNTLPQHPHSDPRILKERPLRGGRSDAPAVLIVVNKGHGIVDAFWFYFYSYNLGRKVLNVRFGNHVGDWEHSLVRFQHGKPKVLFFSEHFFGTAYTYDAVEKLGKRVSETHPSPKLSIPTPPSHSQYAINLILDLIASHLLRHWHPRHVRHPRRAPLHPPLRYPTRRNRPWPALGSPPQHPLLHLHPFIPPFFLILLSFNRPSTVDPPLHPRAPHPLKPHPPRPDKLVLLQRPLGRQVVPHVRQPAVPVRRAAPLCERAAGAEVQAPDEAEGVSGAVYGSV